ncbi:MAG: 2OG-Fe(II) oxygenase, partial [Acidimicrobiales bacterium]
MVQEPRSRPAARDRLASLLAGLGAAGSYCASRTAPTDDLHIEVRGVGALRLPVPKEQARRLIGVARPARHGLGEATLLDRRVRDTWEVPKSRVKIDQRRWSKTLLPVLDELRADLGLPAGCRLTAELHAMLVYARGQFFVPHQDTEKSDGMVGSLVVTVPAAFTGGGLVVTHGAERATYRSSKERLSFVAFYADCRHEIKPVRSGHRIVLTYNLSVRGDPAGTIPEVARGTVDALAACLQEHFSTPVPPPSWRHGAEPSPPPDRLVYLLDHEYTQRGLSGAHLKGADATRAAALRSAAEQADCEVVLALADISETWNAYEPGGYDRPYRGWRYQRDEDEADHDDDLDQEGEYELEGLIDSSISLDHWSDWSGRRAERIVSSVGDHEVCATTPTNLFEPYASEYEPYMGNYGNTLDRQYRRAALVVWPRGRAFAVRAEASPRWALGEVAARLKAGTVDEARRMVRMLEPSWPTTARGEERGLFTRAVRVAGGLDDPELAAALLAPFRLEMASKSDAPGLAALADRYGDRWLAAVIAGWSGADRPWGSGGDRPSWVAALPRLCAALRDRGTAGTAAASLLVGEAHGWLAREVESRRR